MLHSMLLQSLTALVELNTMAWQEPAIYQLPGGAATKMRYALAIMGALCYDVSVLTPVACYVCISIHSSLPQVCIDACAIDFQPC